MPGSASAPAPRPPTAVDKWAEIALEQIQAHSELDESADLPLWSRHVNLEGVKLATAGYIMLRRGFHLERMVLMALALSSTLFFVSYRYDGELLNARLRFQVIVQAALFPVTFLVVESAKRREYSIDQLSRVKAMTCQVTLALLTWRCTADPKAFMGEEWDNEVMDTMQFVVRTYFAVLRMPTSNLIRHVTTARGRAFAHKARQHARKLCGLAVDSQFHLHTLVQELKERGAIQPPESQMLFREMLILHSEWERVLTIKTYRTPLLARAFVRVAFFAACWFYGAYYSYVYLYQTSIAFVVLLSLWAVFLLGSLATIHQALEDPFVHQLSRVYRGDILNLQEEERDFLARLREILASVRHRREVVRVP
jgi:hypothetical protein